MVTKIEKYNSLLHQILSDFAENFDEENTSFTFILAVQKYFDFEKPFYWNLLMNAIYIFEDTELAKSYYTTSFQNNEHGENYLKLYGILNALYQQRGAVTNLMEIFNMKNRKQFTKSLQQSKIMVLRNKIGAHPADSYSNKKNNPEYKYDVYEISRHKLSIGKIVLLKNQDIFESYNILEDMKSFNMIVEEIYLTILEKVIMKIFNIKSEHFKTLALIKA